MALYNRSRPEALPDGRGFLLKVRLSGWLKTLFPIIDQVNSAVMACDGSGRIVVFNSEAERILGISRAEVLGKGVVDEPRCTGAALVGLSRVLEEALRAGEQYRRQTLRLREEDYPSILGYTTSSLFSEDDEPLGAVVVFADLTQESARSLAGQDAEQLVQMSRLASLISHEVKNPLATIQLYANLLLSAPGTNPEEASSVINSEVAKARQRLDSIQAGLFSPVAENPSAAGFCNLTLQTCRFCSENAEACTSAQGSMAEIEDGSGIFVPLGETAVSALIFNLANYTGGSAGPSAARGVLSCNVSADDNWAFLDITRSNLDASILEAVASTTLGTADLNLWIARQIVQRGRGRLVIGQPAGQITVRAVLPRLTSSALRGRTILVVDDEERLRTLMCRLLRSAGVRPLEAENGLAALELLSARELSMVITDAIMPKLDGFQVADAAPTNIPVLIVSGSGGSTRLSALNRKHTASLSKPFSSEQLLMSLAYLAWEAGL